MLKNEQSRASTVLCFGYDMALLMTRQWLLEQRGYDVLSAMVEPEFHARLTGQPVRILDLCQTLPPPLVDRALAFTHQYSPSTRCLTMFSRYVKGSATSHDVVLDVSNGPATFLRTVKHMLPA